MRISAVIAGIICSATLSLFAADTRAQSPLNQTITIEIKDQPLQTVFQKLAAQTSVSFSYLKHPALQTHVSLRADKEKLGTVLDRLFANLPYSYSTFQGKVIIRYVPDKQYPKTEEKKEDVKPDITGKVTDEKGEPLPGATVRVKGTALMSVTDVNGNFRLTGIQDTVTLVISFVGYKTAEIKVSETASSLSIRLEPDASALTEVNVVSTGYQELPLERVTGSFSKVNNDLYDREVSTDVISRLKAIAPSLLFDERSGTTKLNIRGRSTIFANDQPLIIVDNFPFEGNLNNINPNDIQDITILKDAAAASIWGVRAGNGVIVVTTKKGIKSSIPQIELNTNITIGEKPDLFYQHKISSSDFIDVENYLFGLGYYNSRLTNTTSRPTVSPVVEILARQRSGLITATDATSQVNSYRDYDIRNDLTTYLYQKSINQQYSLNVRGGSNVHTYYYSSSFDNNRFNTVGNVYDRLHINGQHSFMPVNNLSVFVNLNYTQSRNKNNSTLSALTYVNSTQYMYPYTRLADDEGNPMIVIKDYRQSFKDGLSATSLLNWNFVPLQELNYSNNLTRLTETRFNTGVDYTILKGLKIEFKYQLEKQQSGNRNFRSQDTYYTRNLINRYSVVSGNTVTRNIPLGGIYSFNNNDLNAHNGRGQLSYNREWAKQELSAIAGYEIREVGTSGTGGLYYGYDPFTGASITVQYGTTFNLYPSGTGTITAPTNASGTLDRFRSYFSNAGYTYDKRYTLSASARIDQSNLFGVRSNQRSVPLWSVGGKWFVDEEKFYRVDWLPSLKIRATYGYNGNFDNTVTAFTTASIYSGAYYINQPFGEITSPPNDQLKWERIGVLNLGVDFATRNNRIYGTLEYYTKKGRNLIGSAPINPTTGLSTFRGNVAHMKGKGLDIELNTRNIDGASRWTTAVFFSYAKDQVTRYNLSPDMATIFMDGSLNRTQYDISPVVGKPVFGIYSYKWAGLDPANGDPQGYLNGAVSKNYSSIMSGTPVDSLKYHGPALPPFFGAVRNDVTYRQLSLSFNIAYRFGYYFRRNSISYGDLYQYNSGHSDYSKRWQHAGDEQHTDIPSAVYPINLSRDTFYGRSEVLVEKGDNIRLQDIQLSFDIDKAIGQHSPFRNTRIYLYANNIGILWKANKQGLDPDAFTYPASRTIAIGISTKIK